MLDFKLTPKLLTVAIPLAIAGSSMPTFAQQDQAMLEEIVVTAQRREESLQDVPLTITALSGESLTQQGINTVSDLSRTVPGLQLCCQRGEVQFPYIRGIPGVRGYFAEVPAALDGSAFYFDLASVQVLKGPQGTLFGTATNGGAILNEPNRPTDDWEGYVSGEFGNFDRRSFEGVLNIPVSDSLQIRAGVKSHKTDGYVTDTSTGDAHGNEDYTIIRFGVNFDITDQLNNYFVLNWYDSEGRRPPFTPFLANPDFWGAVNPDFYETTLAPFMEQQAQLGLYDLVGTTAVNRTDRELLNISNQTTWEIGEGITVRNILGYGRTKNGSQSDVDGTPFAIFDSNVEPFSDPSADELWSEELQVRISLFEDKLDLLVGTFNQWFDGGTSDKVAYNDLSAVFGILTGSQVHNNESKTHSIYADGTYDLSEVIEGLSMIAGIRRTKDDVELEQTNSTWVRIGPGVNDLLDLADINVVPNVEYDLSATFEETTYRLGLQYQVNQDAMLYFTYSRGYSSGGFNLNNPRGAEQFEPESLDNYEIGLKSHWNIGTIEGRTNISAYFGIYDDVQVSTTQRVCSDPADDSTCTFGVGTFNAAEGEIQGFEMDFAVLPTDWLEIGGNVGYLDAKYTDYVNDPDGDGPTTAVDLSSTAFVYVPEWKYTLYTDIGFPIDDSMGDMSLNITYTWQDEVVTTATPNPQFFDMTDSYDNITASLDWKRVGGNDAISASLFGMNLGDNETADGQFGAYNALGLWGVTVAVPRQYGLRIRYDF